MDVALFEQLGLSLGLYVDPTGSNPVPNGLYRTSGTNRFLRDLITSLSWETRLMLDIGRASDFKLVSPYGRAMYFGLTRSCNPFYLRTVYSRVVIDPPGDHL
jgi:hypothetical protein